MPRRAARKDANHKPIVQGLEAEGYGVIDLAAVGNDIPDILLGTVEANVLLEIKNPERAKHKHGRREEETRRRQDAFRARWPGPIEKVWTLEEALEIGGRYGGPGRKPGSGRSR